MLVIGLTGGIASGKSTATEYFASRGVPVIDADQIAREVVAPGSHCLRAIREAFGSEVIAPHGGLDRRRLRDIVFADPTRRRQLENLLHPPIQALIRRRLAALDAPWAVLSVPLLVGSELLELVDRVLVIDVDETTQLERVMARDRTDAAQAQAILAAQSSRAQRLAIADDVVDNRGTLPEFLERLARLARRYDRLAADQGYGKRRGPRRAGCGRSRSRT